MGLTAVPLGKLEKVRVREAWPDEARNFTPWLATEGIEILSGELGVDLKVLKREHAVGIGVVEPRSAEYSPLLRCAA